MRTGPKGEGVPDIAITPGVLSVAGRVIIHAMTTAALFRRYRAVAYEARLELAASDGGNEQQRSPGFSRFVAQMYREKARLRSTHRA